MGSLNCPQHFVHTTIVHNELRQQRKDARRARKRMRKASGKSKRKRAKRHPIGLALNNRSRSVDNSPALDGCCRTTIALDKSPAAVSIGLVDTSVGGAAQSAGSQE